MHNIGICSAMGVFVFGEYYVEYPCDFGKEFQVLLATILTFAYGFLDTKMTEGKREYDASNILGHIFKNDYFIIYGWPNIDYFYLS